MTTKLQPWGNSQGVRLPKALLAALRLKPGAELDVKLSPKKDAIIVKPANPKLPVRERHRIEDLAAAMPRGYRWAEFDWGSQGREVW
jgi:antitoxin MazE